MCDLIRYFYISVINLFLRINPVCFHQNFQDIFMLKARNCPSFEDCQIQTPVCEPCNYASKGELFLRFLPSDIAHCVGLCFFWLFVDNCGVSASGCPACERKAELCPANAADRTWVELQVSAHAHPLMGHFSSNNSPVEILLEIYCPLVL